MAWWKFYACLLVVFLGCNLLFAGIFFWLGPESLRGLEFRSEGERFFEAFNFSVQTMSTIGYGGITPRGTAANLLVVTEVLVGLLGLALATGFLFARFSRPGARILFSRQAVIAPYRGISALEFRIANERNSQLTNVQAKVVLSPPGNRQGTHHAALPPAETGAQPGDVPATSLGGRPSH